MPMGAKIVRNEFVAGSIPVRSTRRINMKKARKIKVKGVEYKYFLYSVNTNKTILKEVRLQALEESLTEEKLVHPLFKDAKRLSEIGNDSPMTDEEKRVLGLL